MTRRIRYGRGPRRLADPGEDHFYDIGRIGGIQLGVAKDTPVVDGAEDHIQDGVHVHDSLTKQGSGCSPGTRAGATGSEPISATSPADGLAELWGS